MLQTLRGIGEIADARALEIREARRMPADIVERLIDSGVFRTWVPACYGGRGGTAMDLFESIEALAYYEASAAWCVMVGGTTALTSGFLSPDWAREIYGDPRAVTGGFANPLGRGCVVDGGLRVTGRWGWGSGTTHCTWIVGGVSISADGGSTAVRSDGLKTPVVFFPRSEVKLHDNWRTLGLAGTGSVDYEVDDVFVPEGRWAPFPMLGPVIDEPLYHFSSIGALATGVAFVSVGIARRAIDEILKLATVKVPAGGARPLSDRAQIQSQVIEAEAAWLSARAVLREQVEACWHEASTVGISINSRRLLRVAAINATERSARAVDICYVAGGGSSIHDSSVLQRLFRDVHTATQHGANGPLFMERLGRMALGVATETGVV
jgi:alkylation response protein AidB-like acyl-CoA dehydrogenase